MLTLLFQISKGFIYKLRGSFELLCELVSLFTYQTKLFLEVGDAAGQHRKDGKEIKEQRGREAIAKCITKQAEL